MSADPLTLDALFEAFKAGDYRVNNEHPKDSAKDRFFEWVTKTDSFYKAAGTDLFYEYQAWIKTLH